MFAKSGFSGRRASIFGLVLAAVTPSVAIGDACAEPIKVLYAFGSGEDGSVPAGGLTMDKQGTFYGTTSEGGTNGSGTVFTLSSKGVETVIYSFTGAGDGDSPEAGVILNKKGALFGTTKWGGASNEGVVFEAKSSGTETVMYSFTGGNDGGVPLDNLFADKAGNLYGTTFDGGSSALGTVFMLTPTGTETALHSFAGGTDGSHPDGDLVADKAKNFYGVTVSGGSDCGCGTIFKLAPDGTETILHTFLSGSDGAGPLGNLLIDKLGNLYGSTVGGGTFQNGTVFKLAANGTETVLYSFSGGSDGGPPNGGLVADKAGNLYGTAGLGGISDKGVVFKIAPDGKETVLYAFTGGNDGANPSAGLLIDKQYLYGTTQYGGMYGGGTVFRVKE
jgi:uncharacterized repeat protein (TIGR03803 family)